jgi:hypothetical protein
LKLFHNAKTEFDVIKKHFEQGKDLELANDLTDQSYRDKLSSIAGLEAVAATCFSKGDDIYSLMELVLFGLSESQVIGRNMMSDKMVFSDPLSELFLGMDDEDDEDL